MSIKTTSYIKNNKFPKLKEDSTYPLLKDYTLCSLLQTKGYFDLKQFNNKTINKEEKYYKYTLITV